MNEVIKTCDGRGNHVFTLQYGPDEKIIATICNGAFDYSFGIGFRTKNDKRWHYQHLIWSCRGGKSSYFSPMVQLYRYLRKNRISDLSLRRMASGENASRNGGFAIRTDGHKKHLAMLAKIAAERDFDRKVEDLLPEAVHQLASEMWLVVRAGRRTRISMLQPNNHGYVRDIWITHASSDYFVFSRSTGRPGRNHDPVENRFDYAVRLEEGV